MDNVKSKPKVAGIFPLNSLQQALLFHSVTENKDQGLIQFQATIEGHLDLSTFSAAWQSVVDYQPAMRSSVHWEKIEKPVRVVRPSAQLSVKFTDLSQLDATEQQSALKSFKTKDADQKIDLTKASCNRLHVFRLTDQCHEFFWTSHHILLDGWSSGIIINNVFHAYARLRADKALDWPTLPAYTTYLEWLRSHNHDAAKAYWKEIYGTVVDQPRLTILPEKDHTDAPLNVSRVLSAAVVDATNTILQERRATFQSLSQAIWVIVQRKLLGINDLRFSMISAGRGPEVEGLEKLAGLFTNNIPVRFNIEPTNTFMDWLDEVQRAVIDRQPHISSTQEQIAEWAQVAQRKLETDHLLLVQNYPWTSPATADIKISAVQGDITSNYPVTVMLTQQTEITIDVRVSPAVANHELADWYADQLQFLFNNLPEIINISVEEILDRLTAPPVRLSISTSPNTSQADYQAPATATELSLLKIWERILDHSPLGVNDDFFHSSGTSMLAVRVMTKINQKFGTNLPAVTLVANPTIRLLAALISGHHQPTTADQLLVPLRASGDQPPIFCFHGGLGHVFFYRELAQSIDHSHPVYAVQPSGISDHHNLHASVEEMAAAYLDAILKLCPDGQFHMVGYCFSNLVCVEITRLLRERNLQPASLIIIDSAPALHQINLTKENITPPVSTWRAIASDAYRKRYQSMWERIHFDVLPQSWVDPTASQLYRVKMGFESMVRRFVWPRLNQSVCFVRSSQFAGLPNKSDQIKVWETISGKPLKITIVEGEHTKLFDAPAVSGLARAINAFLVDSHG